MEMLEMELIKKTPKHSGYPKISIYRVRGGYKS